MEKMIAKENSGFIGSLPVFERLIQKDIIVNVGAWIALAYLGHVGR